jgi:hypothetical protein
MPDQLLRGLPYSTSIVVKRLLAVLFAMSVVLDIDMLFSKSLIAHGVMHPQMWSGLVHFLVAAGEVIAMAGATVLWLLMLYFCIQYSGSILRTLLWTIGFMITIWWGAQLYYVFFYPRYRTTARSTRESSCNPALP